MIAGGTVAVFALYDHMWGFVDTVVLVGMAVLTVFLSHVLHFELLPVLFVPLPVPAVHVPPLLHTEVLRNQYDPSQKYKDDDTNDHDQRSENMILHAYFP